MACSTRITVAIYIYILISSVVQVNFADGEASALSTKYC